MRQTAQVYDQAPWNGLTSCDTAICVHRVTNTQQPGSAVGPSTVSKAGSYQKLGRLLMLMHHQRDDKYNQVTC